MSFWEHLRDWKQDRAIEMAQDSLVAVADGAVAMSRRVVDVEHQLIEARQRIRRLEALVQVLAEVMVEKGVANGLALDAKAEATLEALNPRPVGPSPGVAAGGDPYRGGGALPPPVENVRRELCSMCKQPFPVNKLNIKSHGLVCDLCFHK